MIFLYLLEEIAIVLAVLVTFFQVLIPLWRGRPIFPIFREGPKAEKRLAEAKEDLEVVGIEKKAASIEEKAFNQRKDVV